MVAILLIILFMLLAAFFAGAETGAYRLNRVRLRQRAQAGSQAARLLQSTVADMEEFVCMTLAGTNISVYAATLVCAVTLSAHFTTHLAAEFISTLVLAPLFLIFAEVLPKSLFQALPNFLMRWASPLLWALHILLWPVVKLLHGMVVYWRWLLGGRVAAHRPVVTSQYLSFFLSEGKQEGVITAQQDMMVRNIMQFGTRPVRRAMIPLARVHMMPVDASGPDALEVIAQHNHSRLPVYDGAQNNVAGILLVLDYLCNGQEADIRKLMRPVIFLQAGLPLDDAFRLLQRTGQTMGIVVDARDRAIGMVTMGDLLQEIFGTLDAT